jgi:hypothetical protein
MDAPMTAPAISSSPSLDVDLADVRNQRNLILSILSDFLEDDTISDLGDWLEHVSFDLTAIRHPADLQAAWVAHYRRGRAYDVDRAFGDLLSWPPLAERIADLSAKGRREGHEKPALDDLVVDLGNLTNDL